MTEALIALCDVTRRYPIGRHGIFGARTLLTAVDGVSFTMQRGRSLGIVGESGSGKSTLARLVMALERPDEGAVFFDGEDLNGLPLEVLRRRRRQFQMVFQDPFGSLDPRMTVASVVSEPLEVAEPQLSRMERRARVAAILEAVSLPADGLDRYPHEFSGGQRQRIALARALVTGPALVVADEPVSALDVSVQAQVLNLMAELQQSHGLTYLLISHNLAVVEHVADDVLVLYRGRVVEQGPTDAVFEAPLHPYTRALVDAVPGISARKGERLRLGEDRGAPPAGCGFAGRCPFAQERCRQERPDLRAVNGQKVACHFA